MSTNLNEQLQVTTEASEVRDNTQTSRGVYEPEREALELNATASSARNVRRSLAEVNPLRRLALSLAFFWRRQISLIVSYDDCRDHFGEPSSGIWTHCLRSLLCIRVYEHCSLKICTFENTSLAGQRIKQI